MSGWITLDLSDVPAIKQIDEVLDTLVQPLDVLLQILNGVEIALTVLNKVLALIASLDPTQAIIAVLEQLIESLQGGKVHLLLLAPVEKVNPVEYVIRTVSDSFNDDSDFNRPQFDIGAMSCGFVMYASAPDASELLAVIEGFKVLINSGFTDMIDYINAIKDFSYPNSFLHTTGVVTGFSENSDFKQDFLDDSKQRDLYVDLYSGRAIEFNTGKNANVTLLISEYDWRAGSFTLAAPTPYPLAVGDFYSIYSQSVEASPDWQVMPLSTAFPLFGELIAFLTTLTKVLKGPVSLANLANAISNSITKKISMLKDIAAKIIALKEKIQNFLKLNNINLLPIPPQDLGNMGYVSSMYFSENKPNQGNTQYVVGAAVCAGEALYPTISLFLGLT